MQPNLALYLRHIAVELWLTLNQTAIIEILLQCFVYIIRNRFGD